MYKFYKGYLHKMEYDKKGFKNENVAKNDAVHNKLHKKSKTPRCKRKVTFIRSMGHDIFSSNMEHLIITQKVKVKKQKIKCTLNLTNISKTEEKHRKNICKTEEKLSKSGHLEDRIVPQCMRKKCKLQKAVESKTKSCRQKRVEDSLKQSPKVSIKTNKRTRSKRKKQTYELPIRISEKRNTSYESISSDNFSVYSYVDEKLETLIMRTKARERKQKNSFPKPLHTSTPIWQPADELEDITSSSEMDFSDDSQVTFILEPRSETANNLTIFGEDVAACELNPEEIKVESKCDVSDAILDINALSGTNLVISVDPVIIKCEQNSEDAKTNSQCDVSEAILDINATSGPAIVGREKRLEKQNAKDSCELNSDSNVNQVIFDSNVLVKSEEPTIAINELNPNKENVRAREKKTERVIKPNFKNRQEHMGALSSKNLVITQDNAVICPKHKIKTENIQTNPEIIPKETKYCPQTSSSTVAYFETNKPNYVVNPMNIMGAPAMIPSGPHHGMPEPMRTTNSRSTSVAHDTSIKIENKWRKNFNPTNCYYSDPEESYYPPNWEAPNFMFRHTPSYDANMYSGISSVPVWPKPLNYLYLGTPHFPATSFSAGQNITANRMYGHQPGSNCTKSDVFKHSDTSRMYSNIQTHITKSYVPRIKHANWRQAYKPYQKQAGDSVFITVSNRAKNKCHKKKNTNGNINVVPIKSPRIKLEPKKQQSPVTIKIEDNIHQAVQCEPKVIIKQEIIDNDYNTENNNNTVQKQEFPLFAKKPLIVTNETNDGNGDNLIRFIKQEPCD